MSTSSNIWTQCAGASRIRPLRSNAWRVVEAQHQVSTRKLVDTDAEQQVLEQLIETVKPPERTRGRMHYLLFTPFRYPPLHYGSRFGKRTEPGIWYGSERLRTAFAEVAYYRLLFLEGTSADLGTLHTQLTAFQARIETARGTDLTKAPFARFVGVLSSPTDYAQSQVMGTTMREAGVIAFRYTSARDAEHGACLGVFSPAAFGRRSPKLLETWHCYARRAQVELVKQDYFRKASHTFVREQFLVKGELPHPAI